MSDRFWLTFQVSLATYCLFPQPEGSEICLPLSPSMLTGDFGFTLKNSITTYKKQEQTQTQQVQSHCSVTSLLLPSSHSQGTSSSLFNVLWSMSLMFWQLFLNSMVSPSKPPTSTFYRWTLIFSTVISNLEGLKMVSFLDTRPSSLLMQTIASRSSPLSSLQGSVSVLGLDFPAGNNFWLTAGIYWQSWAHSGTSVLMTPHHALLKPFSSLQLFKRTGRLFYICLDSSKLSETNLAASQIPHIAPSKKPDNVSTWQRTKLVSWPIYQSEWCPCHQSKTA